MNAANANSSPSTQPNANTESGVPPGPPEALHQAGGMGDLGLITLCNPITGITAFIRPRKPGVTTISVELYLAPNLPKGFVASFDTLPQAVAYLLQAGYERTNPPQGRVRIADFRDAIDSLNWTRADITGATQAEFLRMDVQGRLTRGLLAVQTLRPGVPTQFADDLRSADACIERARQMIARWAEQRAAQALAGALSTAD